MTPAKWQEMSMAEQAEAWEEMSEAERKEACPTWERPLSEGEREILEEAEKQLNHELKDYDSGEVLKRELASAQAAYEGAENVSGGEYAAARVNPAPARPDSSMTHICKECGRAGRPQAQIKGSFAMEVILWLLFLIPGVIYSIWRLTTKSQGCRHCGGGMVDIGSPRGQSLWKEYGARQ